MPAVMIPSFPVAGLMLAASGVAAPGVDMLGITLLWCDVSCGSSDRRKTQYRPMHAGAVRGQDWRVIRSWPHLAAVVALAVRRRSWLTDGKKSPGLRVLKSFV
jgi:hypothetical protein